MKLKEQLFEKDSSYANRMILQKAQVEVMKYLHCEEKFWRQKADITRFENGNKNIKFFNSW